MINKQYFVFKLDRLLQNIPDIHLEANLDNEVKLYIYFELVDEVKVGNVGNAGHNIIKP